MTKNKMSKLAEILLSPKRAPKHPIQTLVTAFFYTSLSLLLSAWLLPNQASIAMVFLTVIATVYIVQGVFVVEEDKERDEISERDTLRSHARILEFLTLLFFGFLIAFIFWQLVLPETISSNVFSVQENTFQEISSITGRITAPEKFSIIIKNNLRVLLLSILLAIFYGAGSLFILAWNASVMGFIVGHLVKVTGLSTLPQVLLRYSLHGIPEILAYLTGALAGSILFVSIIRGDFRKGKIKRILIDVGVTLSISILILIGAALIETYVSPLI